MFSRAALAVFALVVAEFLVFGYAAQLIGTAAVVWLSVLAALLGFYLIRRFVAVMVAEGVEPLAAGVPPTGNPADRALIVLAGLLLVVPGLLTGAVGLTKFNKLPRARSPRARSDSRSWPSCGQGSWP